MAADASFENPRVLTEGVLDAVGADCLVAAAFLSFEFEPEFFEDAILAPLCRIDGRGSAVVRRLLLEEHLRGMAEVLVLYDHQALRADGPLRQRVAAVPVAWRKGFVHAKHALLLTKGGTGHALVLVTTSANLTRTGWWQNVEVADIERLSAGSASSLRDDLLGLVSMLRTLMAAPTSHPTLDLIEAFVRDELNSASGLPRLWLGRESLPEFVARHVKAQPRRVRLECVAPYVDSEAAPITALVQALQPSATTVLFPLDRLGAGAALASWRDGVTALGGRFGELDLDLRLRPGSPSVRFVHAKAVRLIDEARGRSWHLVGSPNLSVQAHAGWGTPASRSNVETAILRESRNTVSWFRTEPATAPAPALQFAPEEDVEGRPLDIRIAFDWQADAASLWLEEAPLAVSLAAAGASAGRERAPEVAWVATVDQARTWTPLPAEATDWLRRELRTSNLLSAWAKGHEPTTILVEESHAGLAPSKVECELSPSEILRHWSLLSQDQRGRHLERTVPPALDTEDGSVLDGAEGAAVPGATMFDVYSGITHGFLVLKGRLRTALADGAPGEALLESWILGQRHDSLGTLLSKVLSEPESEPVRNIVFALSARELLSLVEAERPGLIAQRRKATSQLRAKIDRLGASGWRAIDSRGAPGGDLSQFREWIESCWSAQPGAMA